jgi:hypothetical protein
LATITANKKAVVANEFTSVASNFDSHFGALEQYRRRCLMRHIQGYMGSFWTLPLGDYLLHIAPAAARATGKHNQQIHLKRWPF